MVNGHFHEKAFIEESYLKRVCLDFVGNELGFWLLKRKTFESWLHIWQGFAYHIFNNFCIYGAMGCHKK
jgi:hypothetical protein